MRQTFTCTFALGLALCAAPTMGWTEVTDRGDPESVSGSSATDTRSFLAGGLGGLIDPARVHFSQSYALNFGTGGGTTYNAGLYTASLSYQLSDPLLLTLHMGVLHSPFSGLNRNVDIGTKVIPGVDLSWRPSDNFMLNVSVNSPNSALYNAYSPYSQYNGGFGWSSDPYGSPLQMGPSGNVVANPRYPRGQRILRPSDPGDGTSAPDPWH